MGGSGSRDAAKEQFEEEQVEQRSLLHGYVIPDKAVQAESGERKKGKKWEREEESDERIMFVRSDSLSSRWFAIAGSC